jgi:hypothetical protein
MGTCGAALKAARTFVGVGVYQTAASIRTPNLKKYYYFNELL